MVDDKTMRKIKREYIAGHGSQQSLADKYGAPEWQVRKTAAKEKWTELRDRAGRKEGENIADEVAKQNAKSDEAFFSLVDELMVLTSASMKAAGAAGAAGVPSAAALEHYANAIGTIQKIRGIKSKLDTEEQQARIDKLRKDIQSAADTEDETGIIFLPPVMGDGE